MDRTGSELTEGRGSATGGGQPPTSPDIVERELLSIAASSMNEEPVLEVSSPIDFKEDAIRRQLDSILHDPDTIKTTRASTGQEQYSRGVPEPRDADGGDAEEADRSNVDGGSDARDPAPSDTDAGCDVQVRVGDTESISRASTPGASTGDALDSGKSTPAKRKTRSQRRREKDKQKAKEKKKGKGEDNPKDKSKNKHKKKKKSKKSTRRETNGPAETTLTPLVASLNKGVFEAAGGRGGQTIGSVVNTNKRSRDAASGGAPSLQSDGDAKKRKIAAPESAPSNIAARKTKRARSPSPSHEEPPNKAPTPTKQATPIQGSRAGQKKRATPSPPSEPESDLDDQDDRDDENELHDEEEQALSEDVSSEEEFHPDPNAITAGERSPSPGPSDKNGGDDGGDSDASSIWDKKERKVRRSEIPAGMYQVKRIINYQKNKKGDIVKVLAQWANPTKGEHPDSWIPVQYLNDRKHWAEDFEMIDKWKESGRERLLM